MTLKTKHSSAPTQCLMVNAAAAHNSSQCTSACPSWTEALYFPNAISLFYRQALSCQTQNISNAAGVLSWNEKLFSSASNDTKAKSSKLLNKVHNQKRDFSNSSICPQRYEEIFGQRISNFAPCYNSNSLASSKLLKKNITGTILKLVNGESHMAIQRQGRAFSFQCYFSPQKEHLKHTPLSRTKDSMRDSLLL